MSPDARRGCEAAARDLVKRSAGDVVVTQRLLVGLLETIDVLVNADDTEEVKQLKAKLAATEGALDGYRKLERMDRVAFIREAFLAIVKASGDGAGDVVYDDDTVWESARRAWDNKPEDC